MELPKITWQAYKTALILFYPLTLLGAPTGLGVSVAKGTIGSHRNIQQSDQNPSWCSDKNDFFVKVNNSHSN
jgi:hypothetical protein